MRVLMLNREDAFTVPGGDTVQMRETRKGLERLGARVESTTVRQAPPLSGFDVVHLFNWQQLAPFLAQHREALAGGPPLVLSPIFWFHTGQWYDAALGSRRLWRAVNAAAGANGRRLYTGWQWTKFRYGREARELRRDWAAAAHILPNSRAEIDYLGAALGRQAVSPARATVVPNGVVRSLFDPLPPPDAAFVREYGLRDFVLQVGRIQAAKNQLGLIRALYDTSVPIVFAGQPSPYEPEYVASCTELGRRRGNVYFLGPRTPEELAGIYVLAAAHVLPSWRETPGLVSLEAAAAGCRVVSTAIGSASEYFGGKAWYCDPGDPASIRRAVLAALDSPPPRGLRERVLERYTWASAAALTLHAYLGCIADRPERRRAGAA